MNNLEDLCNRVERERPARHAGASHAPRLRPDEPGVRTFVLPVAFPRAPTRGRHLRDPRRNARFWKWRPGRARCSAGWFAPTAAARRWAWICRPTWRRSHRKERGGAFRTPPRIARRWTPARCLSATAASTRWSAATCWSCCRRTTSCGPWRSSTACLRSRGRLALVMIGEDTAVFNRIYRVLGRVAPAFWGRQVEQRTPELIEASDFRIVSRAGGAAGFLSVARAGGA